MDLKLTYILKIEQLSGKKNQAFLLIKKKKVTLNNYYYLSENSNLDEAAKNLYSFLRKIKNMGYESIAVEKIPDKGIGKVINDRLKRASNY